MADEAGLNQQHNPPEAAGLDPTDDREANETTTDDKEAAFEPIYSEVKVLLMTFEFHDLRDSLDMETDQVEEAFDRLGYSVEQFRIPMINSPARLEAKLDEFFAGVDENTLAIIYYHGHGGLDVEERSLVFSRYSISTPGIDMGTC